MLSKQDTFFLTIFLALTLIVTVIGYVSRSTGAHILKDIMVFACGFGIAYVLALAGARAAGSREAEAAKEKLRSLCNRSVQLSWLSVKWRTDALR